jgi:hypothetical protein
MTAALYGMPQAKVEQYLNLVQLDSRLLNKMALKISLERHFFATGFV